MYWIIYAAAVLAVLTSVVTTAEEPGKTLDFQKAADAAKGDWPAKNGDPFYCIGRSQVGYGIRIEADPNRLRIRFAVTRAGKDIAMWDGHSHSVFLILDDTLYYADFSPGSDGGTIVAVDLGTGHERWRSKLVGIGVIQHSAYANWITLDVDASVVTIHGDETGGRYIEYKDRATGITVGHKAFPPHQQGKRDRSNIG